MIGIGASIIKRSRKWRFEKAVGKKGLKISVQRKVYPINRRNK